MRKRIVTFGAALALLMSASAASALTVGDPRYVGAVIDGVPPSEANELLYINSLIMVAPGVVDPTCNLAPTEICDRSLSTLAGPLPAANSTGLVRNETGSNTFNATGFEYVIAKYGSGPSGGGSYVWYIADLGAGQTLPTNFGTGGPGLSHYTLFNATTTTVPDGGATAALLGLSMVGLGMLRRRFNL
jgi:hypothetical protein